MADIYVNAKWQIVLTKANCEKKVAAAFTKKDIEYYWPLNTLKSPGKNVTKTQQEPLFKSYIFVRILDTQAATVLNTSGVVNFVYWLNKPAVIKEGEIDTIRLFLKQYHYLHIEKTAVNINESVKSIRGSSITKEGNVTEILHNSTKAILPSLGYILISQIPEHNHGDKVILHNGQNVNVEKLTIQENI